MVRQLGSAQAAAGRQKRNRVEDIRLARAVRPGEHDGARADGQLHICIRAEVGELDAGDGKLPPHPLAMNVARDIPARGR